MSARFSRISGWPQNKSQKAALSCPPINQRHDADAWRMFFTIELIAKFQKNSKFVLMRTTFVV
uniref:Uncharacterized protein n=1 Tax=mine drainage metagenome TaxID=410659 RepID=E6QU74_9ZZZZ